MAHWKQRETVFGEYELAATMPGRWQLRPSDSPTQWVYRSVEKHNEHVTLLREEAIAREEEEQAAFRRWVGRQRKSLELGFGRVSDLEMSEPEYGEWSGVPVVRYQGESPSLQHRFQVLLLCASNVLWTVVYDAFRLTPEQADTHAQAIFDSIIFQ